MAAPIILASASPRRRELLERIGIEIEVIAADVDESVLAGEEAVTYAARVAATKATTVASAHPGRWIVAADTVVEVDGEPLGKAADRDEAEAMLRSLRGRIHRVTTAVVLCRYHEADAQGPATDSADEHGLAVTTEVLMRDFSDAELTGYLDATEWQGKAGAYAVQGMAAAFVEEVRGSVTNVIGLPLAELVELLGSAGVCEPAYHLGHAS